MGVGAESFLDASITTATPTEPDAPLRRAEAVMGEALELKIPASVYVHSILELLRSRPASGELTLEAVCSADVVALMWSRGAVMEAVREMF